MNKNLTAKEVAGIKAILETLDTFSDCTGTSAVNYPAWSNVILDYASKETIEIIGSAKSFSGICASLAKKGYIGTQYDGSDSTLWVTPEGYAEYIK